MRATYIFLQKVHYGLKIYLYLSNMLPHSSSIKSTINSN